MSDVLWSYRETCSGFRSPVPVGLNANLERRKEVGTMNMVFITPWGSLSGGMLSCEQTLRHAPGPGTSLRSPGAGAEIESGPKKMEIVVRVYSKSLSSVMWKMGATVLYILVVCRHDTRGTELNGP
jgi:hypothetical protein